MVVEIQCGFENVCHGSIFDSEQLDVVNDGGGHKDGPSSKYSAARIGKEETDTEGLSEIEEERGHHRRRSQFAKRGFGRKVHALVGLESTPKTAITRAVGNRSDRPTRMGSTGNAPEWTARSRLQ